MNEQQLKYLELQSQALEKSMKRHGVSKNVGILLCIFFALASIYDKSFMIYLIIFLISYTLSEHMYQSSKQHRYTLLILLDKLTELEE